MTAQAENCAIAAEEPPSDRAAGGPEFTEADRKVFERDAKIGLLATVNPDGRPHVTLITSIQARGPRELMFGQFTEGLSKAHVKENPRTGFLVMSPEREVWRGKARWTHETKDGEDYELYNHKPMFRYNAYFGIHTVHYLDVVDFVGKARLSAARLAAGTLATTLLRHWRKKADATDFSAGSVRPGSHLGPVLARPGEHEDALTPWTRKHLSQIKTLKFACYIGADGYPVITLPVACRAVDGRRLVFASAGRGFGLAELTEGRCVAVFAVNLETESVLVRGRLTGCRGYAGFEAGCIDTDWVYNSMPPKHGQIYPARPLSPVTNF